MQKLLLQLDSNRLASVFDEVVAYDGGADVVMQHGGATEADVRDLIHGCIFTRGPKDLNNTAVFIGGSDMAIGEQMLAAAQKTLFGPFKISMMLDSNGSNTTAVAAVVKISARGSRRPRERKYWSPPAPAPLGCARRDCSPRRAPSSRSRRAKKRKATKRAPRSSRASAARSRWSVCATHRRRPKCSTGAPRRGAQHRPGGRAARPQGRLVQPPGPRGRVRPQRRTSVRHRGHRGERRRQAAGRRDDVRRASAWAASR